MKQENRKDCNTTPQFKDVSRYTRWINSLDEKDKELTPGKRKIKWTVVLVVLVTIFIVSIVFFPSVQLTHKNLSVPPQEPLVRPGKDKEGQGFEMPVDSFEQQLKNSIHENLPEKE